MCRSRYAHTTSQVIVFMSHCPCHTVCMSHVEECTSQYLYQRMHTIACTSSCAHISQCAGHSMHGSFFEANYNVTEFTYTRRFPPWLRPLSDFGFGFWIGHFILKRLSETECALFMKFPFTGSQGWWMIWFFSRRTLRYQNSGIYQGPDWKISGFDIEDIGVSNDRVSNFNLRNTGVLRVSYWVLWRILCGGT